MEEYYYRRSHVPAFGSWDWNNDLPFTQCFDSARKAAVLLPRTYSQDRDLYVAGDLYENRVVTPAMIAVPRTRRKAKDMGVSEGGVKEAASERRIAKAVDEDLYRISPKILYAKAKKKRVGLGLFSSCLLPTCIL